jgi:predicted amidohydrolase
MLRVGYYQFAPVLGQVRTNLKQVIHALDNVRADLVVLPELPFTGYTFVSREELMPLAEDPKNSPTVDSLTALCRQGDFELVTGFAEKAGDQCFNSSLLIGPQGLVHTYRKLHLFNTEKKCFQPGDLPLSVQTVRGARIGMMVCFDWFFPEVARTLALQGAQILCHPSNLVLNLCQAAMQTRCTENLVFAITANRFGREQRPGLELEFTGQSQIVAPRGVVLDRAPAASPELRIVEIDPELADDKKLTPANDLFADRRPGFYGRADG